MELKDIITIFRTHRNAFFMTVALCVALGAFGHSLQKEHVASNLTLNVTRLGSDKTMDYQYHDFYRLQADERFADTVVRWLGSPRIVSDIYADISDANSHAFKAQRLSSQMIQVTYDAYDGAFADKIAQSLVARINREADTLNKDQQESTWFSVVGDDPVVRDGRIGITLILAVSLALGVFLGFWVVLLRHYFSSTRRN
ncbi:MAG: hypothetical protein PHT88_00855 [Candidatus Moranbacteria bacterium]|nr:hypothetical protein [Candidatus Moranbacteria bacterium]